MRGRTILSILAHVVLGGPQQNEPAATKALAYILNWNPNLDPSPYLLQSFVDLLNDSNIEFKASRAEPEKKSGDCQPDITVYDQEARVRCFIENKFWAGLNAAQPLAYLDALPADPPSALIFIVPTQRIQTVWMEIRERCSAAKRTWRDIQRKDSIPCARVERKTVLVTSWKNVLDKLASLAESKHDDSIREDILQLKGLTEELDTNAFLPLREDETTDQVTARRMINYVDLVDTIVNELVVEGIADLKGLKAACSSYVTGRYFRIVALESYITQLAVNFPLWLKHGISPLWWVIYSLPPVVVEYFKKSPNLTNLVIFENDEICTPLHLSPNVEKSKVISDVVSQIKLIREEVLMKLSDEN